MPKTRPFTSAQAENQGMRELIEAISYELRFWKFANNLTDEEAAKKLGVTRPTWSGWVRKGKIQTCQFDKLFIALRRAGISLEVHGGKAAGPHPAGKKGDTPCTR